MTNRTGKILIIDDLESIRKLLASFLEIQGYNSLEASSGPEGIKFIEKNNINLVLLDYMMPKMNGIETLKIIRQKYSSLDLPVIMVTAKNQPEDVVDALRAGANDYITKPLNIPVTIARIETHYLLSKLHRENEEIKQRLKKLSELTFEGILIHSKRKIIDASQTFLNLSGFSLDEIKDKNISDLFFQDEFEKVNSIISDFQGKYEEILAIRKNGTIYHAEIISRDLVYNCQSAVVTIIRDISDKKGYEKIYSQLQNEFTINTPTPSKTNNTSHLKIEINDKNLTVKSMGKNVSLTLTEFNLLNYFVDRKNTLISIDELLENVLKYPPGTGNPDAIRTHITRIRAKIEENPSKPEILINIPRAGYRICL